MSREEIRDELMTLLVAGHETTASELAWCFARLSHEPGVLGRLVEEIDAGEGEEYLTATVQETLRRRPVLPNAAPRFVKAPIEVGGWTYPAGVCLVPNAYLVQHDPEIYPDPYSFRPERFLGTSPGHLHLDPLRRRAAALHRRQLRPAGDADRAAHGARGERADRRRRGDRGGAAPGDHDQPGAGGRGGAREAPGRGLGPGRRLLRGRLQARPRRRGGGGLDVEHLGVADPVLPGRGGAR